ncbi:MAG: DNA primase [Bdellovibrionales bacterium]|nr:DNA primase [Bdellovibrionales bacterium]
MRRISPEFIEQIRMANDIVDVIGEDTFLKRVGVRYMGCCPFPSHNEKTPSFSVSPDKQLYHCFGCGQSGNIFTYLQVKRGMDFVEALKQLAHRVGLSLPEGSEQEEDKTYQRRKKLLEINLFACDFYENSLLALSPSHIVKQYLKERNLSDETVKKFRLGYAPASWDGLFSHLKKKRYGDLDLALDLGLIKKKEDHCYDFFRNRLMFPVFAKNGKDILGFGGRTFSADQAKYINSADSFVFHKGRTFYGWQKATGFIRNAGKALVVEGYTDYLSLYQRDIKNVVATLGTALTEDHARWLSQYAEQVILSFDGDEAGGRAAERSLSVLLASGLIPKILKLEEGMDPDSFIRLQGKEALQKKAEVAQDLFLYLFLQELKKYPAGVDRLSLIEKIAHLLVQTKKEVLRKYYTDRFLDSFGFDEKVAREALRKALKKKTNKINQRSYFRPDPVSVRDQYGSDPAPKLKKAHPDRKKEKLSLQSAPRAELYLLILSLQNLDYYTIIKASGVLKRLSHAGIVKMFQVMDEYSEQNPEYFTALTQILSASLDHPQELQKEQYPSLTYLSKEKVKFFIQDCINKVEEEKKHLHLKSITARMRVDKENADKYLIRISEWTKKAKSTEKEI